MLSLACFVRRLPLILALVVAAPGWAQTPKLRYTVSPQWSGFPAWFGFAVARTGDVDGDGEGDFVVGGPTERDGEGSAYVISGATGETLFGFSSATGSGLFGSAVAGLGDTNGDGVRDVAVGAPSEGASEEGRVYVFSGSTGETLRLFFSPVPEIGGAFGTAVDPANDVDGDGVSDVLIGAPGEYVGLTYVFSGANGSLLFAFEQCCAELSGFGKTVTGVGDVTGDGVPDLAVGSPQAGFGGNARVFDGAAGMQVRFMEGSDPDQSGAFGSALQGIRDVNGNGVRDLLIGAPLAFAGGRAHLHEGASGTRLRTLQSPNETLSGGFGRAVDYTRDLDGDGTVEVVVGAPGETVSGVPFAGRAYVFSGATGVMLYTLESPTPEAGGNFGRAVAWLGDTESGDGLALAVGAYREGLSGRVHVFEVPERMPTPVDPEALPAPAALTVTIAPNPTAGVTALTLALPGASTVRVSVADALGRLVRLAHDGPLPAGLHRLPLDADGLPSGLYVVRADAGGAAVIVRLAVAR